MISETLITVILTALMSTSIGFSAAANQKMGRLVAICENYSYRLAILERAVFGDNHRTPPKK